MAVLMITHDLNLVRHFADRVGVMEKGRLIESATTEQLFAQPREAYTKKLLASQPHRLVDDIALSQDTSKHALLEAQAVRSTFENKKGWFRSSPFVAVHNVDTPLDRQSVV